VSKVEAGKIASEKGKSEAVKQFGPYMVEAHGETSEGVVQAKNPAGQARP